MASLCRNCTLVKQHSCCETLFNSLRPRQNGRHFADDIFKCIFLNENVWILIKISLKFVPQGPIHNIPALVQIMAWCRPGGKPLSGPKMVRLPMHYASLSLNELIITMPHLMFQECLWLTVFHSNSVCPTVSWVWWWITCMWFSICVAEWVRWTQILNLNIHIHHIISWKASSS